MFFMGLGDTLREPYLGISEKGSPEAPTKILIVLMKLVERDILLNIKTLIEKEFSVQIFFKLEREYVPISAFDWKNLSYNSSLVLEKLEQRTLDLNSIFSLIIFLGRLKTSNTNINLKSRVAFVNFTEERKLLKDVGISVGKYLGLDDCNEECMMNPKSSRIELCKKCIMKLKKRDLDINYK